MKLTTNNNIELNFGVFKGGWSYTAKEIRNVVSHLIYKNTLNVREFGCGESTINLYKLLKQIYKNVDYDCYITNKDYFVNHENINCILYIV